jgi:hypothetical protein
MSDHPEDRLADLSIIGANRLEAKPLHHERVTACTILPNGDAVVVFQTDQHAGDHEQGIRVLELTANKWEDTVLSYKVTRNTFTSTVPPRQAPARVAFPSAIHFVATHIGREDTPPRAVRVTV